MQWNRIIRLRDLRTIIQEISDMEHRKKIAVLSDVFGMMPNNVQCRFHLIMRVLKQSYDIVSICRDTPINEEMKYIILPSFTEEKVYATEYFKTNYSLLNYSIFESGALRIELLEWRKDDPFNCISREFESSLIHLNSEKQNIAEFMTRLLSDSLPDDCTKLSKIDYFSCFPNDEEELDLSMEPEYKESYFDAQGNVILEKYGRKRKSDRDDYFFYDGDGRVKMVITCRPHDCSPGISIEEWKYEQDERGRITMTSSVKTNLPSGEKNEYHWQNRWKRNGRLVHYKYDDATKEMASFRPDGKEKHLIYISDPNRSWDEWKREYYYKYNLSGALISEKTKCYKKKTPDETGEDRVEVSYTYYGEDGRVISGKHNQLKGTYLNDQNGNWIQYIERSPNGNIKALIIRSIHYGKGDFFIDTEHNLIHKER